MRIHESTSTKQKIALIIFGLFLSVMLLEIGLRTSGFILLSRQEFRNRTPIEQKGSYHILCLGESTTANGEGNSYPRQLERILNKRNIGVTFKVINKGIPGTNSTSIVEKLENYINKYNPDIIIAMMGINDHETDTAAYEEIPSKKIGLFLEFFRTYKFARLLKRHVTYKIEERKLEIYRNSFLENRKNFKEILELNPTSVKAYVGLAYYYWGEGKLDVVEKMLKKALELDSKNSKIYVDLAICYWGQGNLDQIEELFKKALEINPSNSVALEGLSEYYKYTGALMKREDFLRKFEGVLKGVVEIDPENDEAYVGLAGYYWEQGKLELVEKMYKKALEINPTNSEASENLSDYYVNAGFSDKAAEVLKNFIAINPRTTNLDSRGVYMYQRLAKYYKQIGDFDQAEETLKKAVEINPENDEVFYELLELLHKKQKKKKRRIDTFNKISEIKTGWYRHVTIHNYRKLKEIITRKGIKLVCMQYPVRSVKPLKKIFENKEGLVFVDNERIFKEVLARESYDKYFVDRFGGDFGHCTFKGEKLVAENVANVILKEFFLGSYWSVLGMVL